MTAFTVSVSRRPQLRLFGVSVRTDISNASMDCLQLWEKVFTPRMHEISGKKPGEWEPNYGVCVMLDERNFEYWAALPAREGLALPDGMGQIELPSGFYAGCLVPSLAQLEDAYTWLYETWPKTVTKHRPDMQAPCFEYYDERYMESGAFEVYMPVLEI